MDTVVIFGASVKALDDNTGRVGGYLVQFSTENDPDISSMKDFFTAETDFGIDDWNSAKSIVLFQHGLDKKLGKRRIGAGEMKMDEVGVWIEAQLNLRDEYEKAVYDLAKAGKLGWSSGVPAHLVDRERKDNGAHHIKTWFLGTDASLTPNPAEPRNAAVSLKSLIEEQGMRLDEQGADFSAKSSEYIQALSDLKTRLVDIKKLREDSGRELSDNAKSVLVKAVDEAKSILENLKATSDELSLVINEMEGLHTTQDNFADLEKAKQLLERLERRLAS